MPRANQYAESASQMAARIRRDASQVLDDLMHRRAVSVDGLQMAADVGRLIKELAVLRELEEQATRAGRAA